MAGSRNIAFLKQLAMKKIADEGGVSDHGVPENVEAPVAMRSPIMIDPLNIVTRHDLEVHERKVHAQEEKRNQVEGSSQNAPLQGSVKRGRHDDLPEGKAQKKSKSSKSRHRSETVVVDESFLKDNAEEYRVDPVGAAAKLLAHLAEVRKLEQEEHRRRAQADLEAEKLNRFKTLKVLEEKNALLERVIKARESADAEREKYKGRAEAAEKKVKDLEAQVAQLKEEEVTAMEKIGNLEQQVLELETSLTKAKNEPVKPSEELEREVADLKLKLRKSEEEGARAAGLALEMAGEGFQNALQQVSLIYPSIQADNPAFNVEHEVEGDKIVKVDVVTGKKTVIYPSV